MRPLIWCGAIVVIASDGCPGVDCYTTSFERIVSVRWIDKNVGLDARRAIGRLDWRARTNDLPSGISENYVIREFRAATTGVYINPAPTRIDHDIVIKMIVPNAPYPNSRIEIEYVVVGYII